MNRPSRHLSWNELACNDGTPYPRQFIDDGRVFNLADAFEQIRVLCGSEPIAILSAYRTSKWNKEVGGALKSQHMQGRALDLKPPYGFTVLEFYRLIKANYKKLGINGLGFYKTFVHIDIRPSSHLVAWSSTMRKESIT